VVTAKEETTMRTANLINSLKVMSAFAMIAGIGVGLVSANPASADRRHGYGYGYVPYVRVAPVLQVRLGPAIVTAPVVVYQSPVYAPVYIRDVHFRYHDHYRR